MIDQVEIISYKEDLAEDFARLNIAWLNKYFEVEPIDAEMFSNPKHYFIDKGGYIFFALHENKVVGTFALLKFDENTFELSKMAVDENFQGYNIGNKLMQFCIQTAQQLKIKKLILYSNTKLEPAIHLYKKFGFTEVKGFVSEYARANIKMEVLFKWAD